jgi:hypothetical protein
MDTTTDLTGAIYKIFTDLLYIDTNIISTYVNEISGYPPPTQSPPPPPPPLPPPTQSPLQKRYSEIKNKIEKIIKEYTEKQLNKLVIKEPNSPVILELNKFYHYNNPFTDENNQRINFIEYINKHHSIELTSLCLDSNRDIKHPTILLYLMRCGLNAEQFIYEKITRERFLSYDVYSTFSPDIFLQDAKSFFMTYYLPNFKTYSKYKKNPYKEFLIESQTQARNEKRTREELDELIKNIFNAFITVLGRILSGGYKSSRNKRNKRKTSKRFKFNKRRRTKGRSSRRPLAIGHKSP